MPCWSTPLWIPFQMVVKVRPPPVLGFERELFIESIRILLGFDVTHVSSCPMGVFALHRVLTQAPDKDDHCPPAIFPAMSRIRRLRNARPEMLSLLEAASVGMRWGDLSTTMNALCKWGYTWSVLILPGILW